MLFDRRSQLHNLKILEEDFLQESEGKKYYQVVNELKNYQLNFKNPALSYAGKTLQLEGNFTKAMWILSQVCLKRCKTVLTLRFRHTHGLLETLHHSQCFISLETSKQQVIQFSPLLDTYHLQ